MRILSMIGEIILMSAVAATLCGAVTFETGAAFGIGCCHAILIQWIDYAFKKETTKCQT